MSYALMAGFFLPVKSSIQHQKTILRDQVLKKRLELSEEQIHAKSQAIQNRIIASPAWKKIKKIGLYAPVRHEVDTKLLFMKALEDNIDVFFPRVEQGLKFYEVNDPSDLQKGAYGILEPKHDLRALVEDEHLDVLIVPGVVFDRLGYRLGYGKGFYDQLLSDFPSESIGIAYEFQVMDKLAIDLWDQKVKKIVTEEKEYRFS